MLSSPYGQLTADNHAARLSRSAITSGRDTLDEYEQSKCQPEKYTHRAKAAGLAGLRGAPERHLATLGVASRGGSAHYRKPHPAPDYRPHRPGYDRELGMRTLHLLRLEWPRYDQREERIGPARERLARAVMVRGVLLGQAASCLPRRAADCGFCRGARTARQFLSGLRPLLDGGFSWTSTLSTMILLKPYTSHLNLEFLGCRVGWHYSCSESWRGPKTNVLWSSGQYAGPRRH